MKIKQTILTVMLAWGGQACMGQAIVPEVISSSGESSGNSNGSLSWTMGEAITATDNAGNDYLTQGFQQPSSIVVTAINNPPSEQNSVNVYPNPVSSSIYVQGVGNEQLQIQLMDMDGKVILSKMLSPSENQLDLSEFANGVYLLKVSNMQNQLIKGLKIEKVK
jgi:Secretion system C-terminal sorting domain